MKHRVKIGMAVLITLMVSLNSVAVYAANTNVCHTECKLDHNHQTEICEIDHYGTLLDWSEIPYVWEYNHDNSQSCWYWGVWMGGACYKTPVDSFDIDVRNKVALHCDGEYLYLNAVKATVDGPGGLNGYAIKFKVDGQLTQFQLVSSNGTGLAQITAPGTHELVLKHEMSALSGKAVSGVEAYAYVNDTRYNTEIEVKIPLSAFKEQNANVDLDNINEISLYDTQFTYRPVTTTGISTFPYILGAICAAGVGFIVYGISKKRTKVSA